MWLFNFIVIIAGDYKEATKVREYCPSLIHADCLTALIIVITSIVHLIYDNDVGDRVSQGDGQRLKLIVYFICC